MIVKIIKDASKYGSAFPLIGEYYKAKPYKYDNDKITLIYQVNPDTGNKLDKQHCDCDELDPLINEYRYNVEIIS